MIYLDLAKAFNSVCHVTLLNMLKELNIPNRIFQWLKHFLKSIVLKIDSKDGFITKRLETGLLQGSILSPLLFNFYTTNIHKIFKIIKHVKILQYADDFAIIIQNISFNNLEFNFNTFLNLVNKNF